MEGESPKKMQVVAQQQQQQDKRSKSPKKKQDEKESVKNTQESLQQQQQQQNEKIKLSCVKYIDALWFCYSPFYQVKEYYREGTFDNCRSKWGDLFDCFHLKTLPDAKVQEILQSREKEKVQAHIWKFRSREEAAEAWKDMFGHLQDK